MAHRLGNIPHKYFSLLMHEFLVRYILQNGKAMLQKENRDYLK
jgi:hypothetical protein